MDDDQVNELTSSIKQIANAIYPKGVIGVEDAGGTHVASLTEAVYGLTNAIMLSSADQHLEDISFGIYRIANSMEDLIKILKERE